MSPVRLLRGIVSATLGARVPGTALIETLPLVWHLTRLPASWHVACAAAVGAEPSNTPAAPAVNAVITYFAHLVMVCLPCR